MVNMASDLLKLSDDVVTDEANAAYEVLFIRKQTELKADVKVLVLASSVHQSSVLASTGYLISSHANLHIAGTSRTYLFGCIDPSPIGSASRHELGIAKILDAGAHD